MPEAPAWGGFVALLDEADRAAFLRAGRPRRYRAGQALLLAGDHSDHVLCLLLGGAKISVDTPDGHELLLGIRGQGDLIGELAAVDAVGSTRSANVVALSALDTIVLTGDEFRRFLRSHPGAAEALAVTLVRRLRQADRKRIEFGRSTPRGAWPTSSWTWPRATDGRRPKVSSSTCRSPRRRWPGSSRPHGSRSRVAWPGSVTAG